MQRRPATSPLIWTAPLTESDRVQFLAEHRRHGTPPRRAESGGSRLRGRSRSRGVTAARRGPASPSSTAAFLAASPVAEPAITPMEASAHPGGAGPTFGAPTPQPKGSRGRFRQRLFWESGQGRAVESDRSVSGVSFDGARSVSFCKWVRRRSARQIEHRAHQVLVARVGVDAGGQDRLVAGEALGDPDVLGPPVEVRARGVAKGVEVQAALEAGALLPDVEDLAELPRRQPVAPRGSRTRARPGRGSRRHCASTGRVGRASSAAHRAGPPPGSPGCRCCA